MATQTEQDWLAAYHRFCRRERWETDRDIIITPFDGHYGRAGVVITVNGSPMHGTMLVKSRDITDGTLDAHDKRGGVQAMYVLDNARPPRQLREPDYLRPGNFSRPVKSKSALLWTATFALLVERGRLNG